MNRHLTSSVLVFAAATLLCGVGYPLLVTTVAGALYPHQATGSPALASGRTVGSELIAQQFVSARFFHARPSAVEYQTLPSGASNASTTSTRLVDSVSARRIRFLRDNDLPAEFEVPAEMLCASGSGIDPHISRASALAQCQRIARARGDSSEIGRAALRGLVDRHTEYPFGEPFGGEYVNVLLLNLDLSGQDRQLCATSEKR